MTSLRKRRRAGRKYDKTIDRHLFDEKHRTPCLCHTGGIDRHFLSSGTEDHVINNTGQRITIVSINTKMEETRYTVENGLTVVINVPYKLRVERDGTIWNYDPRPVPEPFHKKIGMNLYLNKFQIEKDGLIYVVLPESNGPINDLPDQPKGYPLRPNKS